MNSTKWDFDGEWYTNGSDIGVYRRPETEDKGLEDERGRFIASYVETGETPCVLGQEAGWRETFEEAARDAELAE